MPTRPSHIPNSGERTALQKLRVTPGLPLAKLYRWGSKLLPDCWQKAGVVKQVDIREGPLYRITLAGETALAAKIPTN